MRVTDNELREFIAEYTQKMSGGYDTEPRVKAALYGKFYHSGDNPKELLLRCEELGLLRRNNQSVIFGGKGVKSYNIVEVWNR